MNQLATTLSISSNPKRGEDTERRDIEQRSTADHNKELGTLNMLLDRNEEVVNNGVKTSMGQIPNCLIMAMFYSLELRIKGRENKGNGRNKEKTRGKNGGRYACNYDQKANK